MKVMNIECDDPVPVLWFKSTHLTRSRQEMNLNIWICQSVEIHRLQTLETARLRFISSPRHALVKVTKTVMNVFNEKCIYSVLSKYVSKIDEH